MPRGMLLKSSNARFEDDASIGSYDDQDEVMRGCARNMSLDNSMEYEGAIELKSTLQAFDFDNNYSK